jgi:hypothetical protein
VGLRSRQEGRQGPVLSCERSQFVTPVDLDGHRALLVERPPIHG